MIDNRLNSAYGSESQPTLRKRDMKVEREVALFLDRHLYTQSKFTYHFRTDDYETQLSGSDIVISMPSRNLEQVIVDEKAQIQYINHPLPTFSLELAFINAAGDYQMGWFIDHDKRTQYYLFVWIGQADDDKEPTADQIHELDYALVSRAKIQKFIMSCGFTKEKLLQRENEIRQSGIYGAHDKIPNAPFYFFYSTQLAEKPINIVIKKRVLLQLAEDSGYIRK